MRRGKQILITALAFAWTAAVAPAARAQINLPQVRVPQLPIDVNKTVNGVTDRLNDTKLLDLRKLQVAELIRTHRDVIERDPKGAAIVRSEVTAFSPSDEALEHAKAAGFVVLREKVLEGLDAKIIVLQAPQGMSTRRALEQLRKLDPAGAYDFNHIYSASGVVAGEAQSAAPQTERPATQESIKVGLIDGGVDLTHAVFRGASIHQYGCGGASAPSAHGTAVASLIAGRSSRFQGAQPGAALYAVDVYCGKPTGGAVDAVADAFAWLARERVPVINVSLVGPPNVTLQNVVRVVTSRGYIVVAAVGNDGPAAPPLYPASYPDVVGVTGVDLRQRALIEAARGKQVDFAAPGADMAAAGIDQTYASVRGTSFAAPFVAGLLAAQMPEPSKTSADRAIAALTSQALDLGSRGIDSTYGNGLVGGSLRVEPALAKAREN
jgi:hypothetical protein